MVSASKGGGFWQNGKVTGKIKRMGLRAVKHRIRRNRPTKKLCAWRKRNVTGTGSSGAF